MKMTLKKHFQNKSSSHGFEQSVVQAWAKDRGFNANEIKDITIREDPCGERDMIQLCAVDYCTRYRTETVHKSVIEGWLK